MTYDGELGSPKLAQIFAYGKCQCIYTTPLHGASDLDKMIVVLSV